MSCVNSLTERELAVTRLLLAGRTNRQIAGALEVRESTVRGHVSSVLRKMGVGRRTEVAAQVVTCLRGQHRSLRDLFPNGA